MYPSKFVSVAVISNDAAPSITFVDEKKPTVQPIVFNAHIFNKQSAVFVWVKMSVYPFEIVTVVPAELYGIGAGLVLNRASVKESVQSTGSPVTEMESFVKTSYELS